MIKIKTKKEIEIMRQGGKILANILFELKKAVTPGITTEDLENLARYLIKKNGGRSAFLGYASGSAGEKFPTVLCLSINDEVVHAPAIPSRKIFEGDIISIDIGLEFLGVFTDMAITVPVGKVSQEAEKLIQVTQESLNLGIQAIMPGNSLNSIAHAIQDHIEKNGFSVVRDLVGHGVGKEIHEEPQIPNFILPVNDKIILRPGMTLAIEPMVNSGSYKIKRGNDPFTILTADGSLSAHFEHTVAVTENGFEILTK